MSSPRLTRCSRLRVAACVFVGLTGSGCGPDVLGVDLVQENALARAPTQEARAANYSFTSTSSNVSGDGLGMFSDSVCGVIARVFQQGTEYLDGNMQLDNPRAPDRKCPSLGGPSVFPRKLTITYPDNALVQSNSGGLNVRLMGTVLAGTPEERSMNIAIAGSGARCTQLSFGTSRGGSAVLVTRTGAGSWNVSSQAGGGAACTRQDGGVDVIPNFAVSFDVALK